MHELRSLGYGPFFEQQVQGETGAPAIPARVAADHRGAYEVWSATGAAPARLAGRLRHRVDDGGLPCAGDWVLLDAEPAPGHVAVIRRVLSRRTAFTRGAAGRAAREQVVAANVDIVFVIAGLDQDVSVRRIQRYVARVWASGARPAVVLNKADLCDDAASCVAAVEDHCPGVPVHVVSALSADDVAALRASVLPGMTAALAGPSGAGKSTLVNALLGEERMRTGAVRAHDGRGRHVTTHRQLVLLPGGGLLVDTPGMRELQLADSDGLDAVFGDVEALAAQCRYRDCRHDTEPGCAVRAAVASGALDVAQLEHHRKLAREAEAFERRHDARLRHQAGRLWGQLHDEAARLRRWKGGKS